jgi:Phosphoesterase family/Putative Ig domain/Abnormal spindle-like microcephaly-assoc'd, ASPM-SPD-2-Hydin/Immunoglobulin I-set domain/Protein of unknown function (DUF1565)
MRGDRLDSGNGTEISFGKVWRSVQDGVLILVAALAAFVLSGCTGMVSSSRNPGSTPVITTQPASQTVTAGQPAAFAVLATGTAPLSYQWQRNGANIAGAASASYTTPATTTADTGSAFRVVVSNTAGTVTSAAATLTVNAAAVAPAITTQPSNQTVTAGQSATFTVVATGTAPLSYQWQRNGGNITGATSPTYTTPATAAADSGATFRVVVSNTAGTVTSAAATLTVNAAASLGISPSSLTFGSQTVGTTSAAQLVTLTNGSNATMTFSATFTGDFGLGGTGTCGNSVTAGASCTVSVKFTPTAAGTRTGALTLTDNAPNSPQTVQLTGTGAASTPVAPTITTQPVSQTVTVGQTAAFTVTATGTAPLAYQWQKNGSNIAGASTSSYTTPATTSADNGAQFTVAVSNSAGSVTSNAATLTVTTSTTPQFGHVAIVVEENTNYASVVGSSSMPYLNGLINQFGLATQYYANTHPSIGNYFMLATGQILTNDDTQTPTSFPVSADNIAHEIELAGKTWKDYRELTGTYYVRHDPLAYMTNINSANLLPFAQFATDLTNGTLPNFSWIAPNGCDDAHDCPLSTADSWLQTNIDPLIKSSTFQKDGLLIIVFDESANDNTDGGGRVAAVLISPAFSHVAYQSTTFYQHESTLRLMLEGLGNKTLPGAAATAPAMWEFFDPAGATTAPLTISTTSLPAGAVGQGYSAQLNATGGTAPYTWSVVSGSLPAGLTLSSSGAISGAPSTAGTSTFTVKLTDLNMLTAQQSFSISINPAIAANSCAPTGSGVCYYVSPAGSDSNSGTSAAPFLTIQKAADVANPGDMVIVRDGTYNNSAVSGVGSKLIVMSRGGTAANHVVFIAEHKWGAKIDGLNNTSATGWEFSANYIDVKDFECEGFSDTCMENYNGGASSGGQFIDIAGNNIHDIGRYCATTTTGRDGIFVSNDNVTIEGNQIHDIGRYAPGENGCTNSAYYQNNDHGVYIDGAFTSANNVTIKNNIFYRNERGWSIQVYPAAVTDLRILNNTFLCANLYRNGHITLAAPVTNSNIENNISWQPTTGFLQYDNTSGYSNLSVANNLTYQGAVGAESAPGGVVLSGNLDNVDPLLVSAPVCTVDDPSVPNAYLLSGSPAIDAGLTLSDVPIDYAGTLRPQGIRFDIGAFEFIF